MSFTATFYTFSKRINSTKQPSGGTSYSIILKAPSGVLNPNIQLDIGQDGNPSSYTYCYIAEFARYYWVSHWRWDNRLWTAECKVDSMSSWKNSIGSSTEYVIRAASARNPAIMDGLYPVHFASGEIGGVLASFYCIFHIGITLLAVLCLCKLAVGGKRNGIVR